MIEHLGSYPSYKNTAVPWLGDVPDHWDVKRNKLFLGEVDERSEQGSEDLLSVSQYTGVTRRRERVADGGGLLTNAASLVGYKRVTAGDLVMNIMLAWNGSLGVSPVEGIVSPAYCVFRANTGLEPRFLHYLFRTPLFTGVFKTVSTGVVDSRLRLYPDVFFRLPTPLPPLDEQVAIVRFLDHADRRIRRYIAAKKRLIALLNEQKQAIIRRAMTRGLDLAVTLMPSGIDWVGDIPEHWAVPHIRYLTQCLDGRRVPLNAVQRGTMQGDVPYWGANRVIDGVADWLFDEPLVLLGEDGAPFFEAGRDVAFFVTGKVWVNNHAHVLRCGSRLEPQFLAHALNCVDYMGFIDGSTRDKLTQQSMGSIPIPLPPFGEQVSIVRHIHQETSGLSLAATRANRQIELLREYRTRLITDVVTGKLDVREAAAHLPDEAEEAEPLDDASVLAEGDESDDEADLNALAGEVVA